MSEHTVQGNSVGVSRLVLARLLAWRSVSYRPWRSALLCGGFGIGVGVMIVLLAVGEAMVSQASQERLVGGGEVTVLPEGIDIEVLTRADWVVVLLGAQCALRASAGAVGAKAV